MTQAKAKDELEEVGPVGRAMLKRHGMTTNSCRAHQNALTTRTQYWKKVGRVRSR